jgi:hypothetical protein
MTTVNRLHPSSDSERETNESVVESGDTEIIDQSKENEYNSFQKVKREMKSEARANKSPDIINGSSIPKLFLADDNNMTTATHVDGNCMDERLKQKAIKGKNIIEKWRIIRDILMISLAFMVHFTAFIGTSHLQSSVNAAEGLGTRALMTIYVGLSVSAIFLPVLLIKYVNSYCRMHYTLQLS